MGKSNLKTQSEGTIEKADLLHGIRTACVALSFMNAYAQANNEFVEINSDGFHAILGMIEGHLWDLGR